MFKKLFGLIVAVVLSVSPMTASAAVSHSFGGYHSAGFSSSRSFSSAKSYGFGGRSSYHSGYTSPSSRLGRSYSAPSSGFFGSGRSGSGLGSHLFSFGAGFMLGHLFHPFGGYYGGIGMGYGYHSFSLLGLLFDILILYIIWRVIRSFFRRR